MEHFFEIILKLVLLIIFTMRVTFLDYLILMLFSLLDCT